MKKSGIIAGIIIVAELAAGFAVMGEDMTPAVKWWGMMLVLGIAAWPLCAKIFSSFTDKGYVFGKILGGLIPAWIMWFLGSLRLLKFGSAAVILITLLSAAGFWLLSQFVFKKQTAELLKEIPIETVLIREAIFTAAFVFFCYVKCNNPDAFGTERMMDYGFMQSIFRTEYFPPEDFWFAGENLNYYYFGQYIYAFLTKLSLITPSVAYNICMCCSIALPFSMCFCIGQMLMDTAKENGVNCPKSLGTIAGILTAFAAMIFGNSHSFYYDEESIGNGLLDIFTSMGFD
ncbi:MAG: hypothetical protein IKN07_07875, partial [Lachnospiraceae bacterium]|nr:hypothetical protein [Lachnospiraceae bacterium]